MKHTVKITLILMSMFLITQLIGLFVIQVYNDKAHFVELPYGTEPPPEVQDDVSILSLLISFVIAISIFILLMKLNAETFIRIWFFVVISLAVALALYAIFVKFNIFSIDTLYISIIAMVISIPLAYIKIFKRNILVHNITELLIYPGIAAVFIPILNIMGIIILLLLISLYDIWAVWHTSFMQSMAKYQINNLKIFGGFFVPYADKKSKLKIKQIKEKYQNKSDKFMESKFKEAKVKVNLAILGGGDVVFPIITAGVFYKITGSLTSSLIITAFATIALLVLFTMARKGKFYPAMPFLTIGLYLGMIVDWILISLHII
ncbi:MAG: presenilin family intramembrane aspartyl protease [Candidatus Pacearchaeota archaeon]